MDLNLVRVFVAIYETRSLTTTGERLFVTPSAVSQALGRLRQHFDDPLFERTGRTMVPTAVGDRVYPALHEALVRIDRTLDDIRGFEPRASDRVFRIALSELGEIGWLPSLFDAVHRQAPHVRLEVVPLAPELLPEWLGRGSIDIAVTPAQLSGAYERVLIKQEEYGVVMASTHPLANAPLTLEAYRHAHHASVQSDSGAPLLDAARWRAGLEVIPLVTLQHFASLPHLLTESEELLATIPRTIASGWRGSWPLTIHDLPFAMAPIELSLYRRITSQGTSALDWLYSTVGKAIAGSSGEFSAIHVE